jgi:predicted dehydrogenase
MKSHPDGEIIALADKNEQLLYSRAADCDIGKEHCYTSLSEALKKERADILFNITPHRIHKKYALKTNKAVKIVNTEHSVLK